MSVNVLVVGATGYIGGAIVDMLMAQGHTVIGLARSEQTAYRLQSNGVTAVPGVVGEDATWLPFVDEVDAVVFAWLPSDGAGFAEVDTAAVHAVLHRLRGTGKAFVYVTGSLGTGDTGDVAVDERTPSNPPPFLAWRFALETTIRQAAAVGVRSVVVRAPMVYGRQAGFITTSLLTEVESSGNVHYVGDGDNLLAFVHVDDLAVLVVAALDKAPAGALYLAANDDVLTYRGFATRAAEALHADAPRSVPVAVAAAAMGPFAEALTYSQRLSTTAAREQLGWQPHQHGIVEELRTVGAHRRAG